jgi:uncharacterized membrane protein HdeD (DUF308 family)
MGVVLLLWADVWFGVARDSDHDFIVRAARLIALALGAVAILELVLAYGVWALRSWAWPFGVGLLVVSIGLTLLSEGHGYPGAHLLSLVVEIGALWYLLSPGARRALQGRSAAD